MACSSSPRVGSSRPGATATCQRWVRSSPAESRFSIEKRRLMRPAPLEAATELDSRPATVEGICAFLVQRGRLVRLDGKFLIHRAVLDEVATKGPGVGVRELRGR